MNNSTTYCKTQFVFTKDMFLNIASLVKTKLIDEGHDDSMIVICERDAYPPIIDMAVQDTGISLCLTAEIVHIDKNIIKSIQTLSCDNHKKGLDRYKTKTYRIHQTEGIDLMVNELSNILLRKDV